MELFRREAVESRRSLHVGGIRIARPVAFTMASGVACTLAIGLVLFAAFAQASRKTTLPGLLDPVQGLVQIAASHTGTVREVYVKEGAFVAAGDPVVRIATDHLTADGQASGLIAAAMNQRRAMLLAEREQHVVAANQRENALASRKTDLQAQLTQSGEELELAQRRVALAERTTTRFDRLVHENFVSPVQAQQKQEELLDAQARAQAARRARLAAERELSALAHERAEIGPRLAAQLAQLDRAIAGVDQEATENHARREAIVAAQSSGEVSSLVIGTGQPVRAGQTLLSLVPQDPALVAHLYAGSRSVGFLAKGQEVWLRLAAYPFQKFGMIRGRIVRVGTSPALPRDLPAAHAAALVAVNSASEPVYRVEVELDRQTIFAYGEGRPLRTGLAVDADVMHERRAIWEWFLEPLLAASAKARSR